MRLAVDMTRVYHNASGSWTPRSLLPPEGRAQQDHARVYWISMPLTSPPSGPSKYITIE